MSGYTLLAMAPSGDTYLARDPGGLVWLLQPVVDGESQIVEPDTAERAVATHGFERIDRTFPSWRDLDDFVEEQAARSAPGIDLDPAALDVDDVRRLLGIAANR